MLKKNLICASLLLTIAFAAPSTFSQTIVADAAKQVTKASQISADEAMKRTRLMVEQVVKDSYPELKDADIQVQTFRSESVHFTINLFVFLMVKMGKHVVGWDLLEGCLIVQEL